MDKCTQSSIPLSFPPSHFRASLHWASKSTLRQLCSDVSTCNTAVIENNGVAQEWNCNPFSSHTIAFNETSITSVIAELSQSKLGVNGPLLPSPPPPKNHALPLHPTAQHTDLVRFVNLLFPRWEPSLPYNLCGNDSPRAFLFPTVVYCIVYVKEMANSV